MSLSWQAGPRFGGRYPFTPADEVRATVGLRSLHREHPEVWTGYSDLAKTWFVVAVMTRLTRPALPSRDPLGAARYVEGHKLVHQLVTDPVVVGRVHQLIAAVAIVDGWPDRAPVIGQTPGGGT